MLEIVIIGTGPAAISAAGAYRAGGGSAHVTIVGAEPELPYQRPPLSKEYLRGEVARGAFDLQLDGEVDLLLGVAARALESGRVRLADDRVLECEACLLATGSQPVRLAVPGAEHPDVLTLRSRADAGRIAKRASRSVAVVGSGFIGCEAAASLAMAGADVTLVSDEAVPQERRLGRDAGERIAGWLEEGDVRLVLGAQVSAIEAARDIVIDGGNTVSADLVVLATGAAPHGALAEAYGAAMEDGAVRVDSAMRADDFLLAAGDVARAHNAAAGRSLRVEHWGEAIRQGEVAGRTLAGKTDAWASVPGFWATIGTRTVKYKAWGDGFDEAQLSEHPGGAWAVFYRRHTGALVGVLTHNADDEYQRAEELIVP